MDIFTCTATDSCTPCELNDEISKAGTWFTAGCNSDEKSTHVQISVPKNDFGVDLYVCDIEIIGGKYTCVRLSTSGFHIIFAADFNQKCENSACPSRVRHVSANK